MSLIRDLVRNRLVVINVRLSLHPMRTKVRTVHTLTLIIVAITAVMAVSVLLIRMLMKCILPVQRHLLVEDVLSRDYSLFISLNVCHYRVFPYQISRFSYETDIVHVVFSNSFFHSPCLTLYFAFIIPPLCSRNSLRI